MAIPPMHGGCTAACSVQGAITMSGASLSRDRAGGGQANTHNSPMLRKFSETHLLPQRVVLFGGRLIETRNWDGAENALRPEGAAQQQAQGEHT